MTSSRRQAILLTVTCAACLGAGLVSPVRADRFEPSLRVGAIEFNLYGTGLLKFKRLIPVYDAALYVPAGISPENFLNDVPLRLEVVYRVSTAAARFAEAGDEVLARGYSAQELAAIKTRLSEINGLYPDPRRGDRCAITYIPGVGTELRFNGERLGVIEGADFARMYFSIWLGDDPACPRLRRDLLNGGGT